MANLFEPRDFHDGLRLLIQRAGLTVEETASRAGLGVSTLHNYLRSGVDGRVPGARELRRLSHVLSDALEEVDGPTMWTILGDLLDLPAMSGTVATRARMRRKAHEAG